MEKRKICVYSRMVLALGAALCCLAALYPEAVSVQVSATSLSSVTSDSIKEKEDQISQKREEKDNLQGSLSNLQDIKKSLEKQKDDLKKYVEELDGNLAEMERNISELNDKIAVKEEEIRQAEAELQAALEREERQREFTAANIRIVYEMGSFDVVGLFLNSKSMGDFLNRADYAEKLMAYDRQMWESYKNAREYAELCREQLDLEREILAEAKANVEVEQRNLEELIEQKTNDIIRYETDIRNQEKAIREYEQEIRAQDEEIKLLEAAIAEEKRKILESSNQTIIYDGGAFTFPLAKYTRISDEYGMRIHPTLGVQQFHNGVDFASPKGTAIYAAYDGVVVAATYSSTMGNYVMIDHGNELYTIYMHASLLHVKKDDVVVAGETIAEVGSTGRSTGNHLHFSVRRDGSYVSPWEYLKK